MEIDPVTWQPSLFINLTRCKLAFTKQAYDRFIIQASITWDRCYKIIGRGTMSQFLAQWQDALGHLTYKEHQFNCSFVIMVIQLVQHPFTLTQHLEILFIQIILHKWPLGLIKYRDPIWLQLLPNTHIQHIEKSVPIMKMCSHLPSACSGIWSLEAYDL